VRRGLGQRLRQGGAAAVEFAIVLPTLLLLIYGGLVYAYIFIIQQSLTYAADAAAQAAVQVALPTQANDQSGYQAAVTDMVNTVIKRQMSWLPAAQLTLLKVDPPVFKGSQVTVQVRFTPLTSVFPTIGLPGIPGSLPPYPSYLGTANTLGAQAIVNVY
jgi:Flp pilus assembly protein TadG